MESGQFRSIYEQKILTMSESQKLARDIAEDMLGMTYAEGRGRYNLLTDKIIEVCGAMYRTSGDMQIIWARHLSALYAKRDRYKAYAFEEIK
jgi:hypothetical protein